MTSKSIAGLCPSSSSEASMDDESDMPLTPDSTTISSLQNYPQNSTPRSGIYPAVPTHTLQILYRSYVKSYTEFHGMLAAKPPAERPAAAQMILAQAHRTFNQLEAWKYRHERYLLRAGRTQSEYVWLLENHRQILQRVIVDQAGRWLAAQTIFEILNRGDSS